MQIVDDLLHHLNTCCVYGPFIMNDESYALNKGESSLFFFFPIVPLSDAGLYLETTDSDGYSITMPPEAVNHSGADIFELEFIQPEEPLSLAMLYVQVVPTTSSFYINKTSPQSGGIEFEVETNVSLAQGVYGFSLILFSSSLGISPPVVVDVILTVASPGEFCAVLFWEMG